LKWLMVQANRRRQGPVKQSFVKSALKYDEIVAQVVDLDYQIAQKDIFGGDTQREKAARRHYGRYAVIVYHPNDVHVRYSNLMPEAVLLRQERTAQSVRDEWGDKANRRSDLKEMADKNENVVYNDYMDYHDRVIWCEPVTETGEAGASIQIMREEHNLPFLPWITRVGGDTMERAPEHRRRPLLYHDYTSGSWENQNVIETIVLSDVIKKSVAQVGKEEGPMPIEARTTQTDFGPDSSSPIMHVTPGDTYTPLPTPPIDRAMVELADRLSAERSQGTLSQVLKGGDIPSGMSFAALNLNTLTAAGALKPAKELAENAMADAFALFMCWAGYTENSIQSYGDDGPDEIPWDEYDPENLYITVELKPDVALDRQQRANVAVVLLQARIMSREQALEYMGETDPQKIIQQIYMDDMLEAYMQAQTALMVQDLMPQPELPPGQEQGIPGQEMGMEAIQGMMAGAPGGPGFNPQQGGLPPAMGAPGATREGVSGEDMMGNEMMLGMGGV